MPANFPDTPTIGQTFSLDGRTWTWNGTTWDAILTAPSVTFVASDTAPIAPVEGSGWFDTTSGQFFIYYDSGWVEFGTNLTGPQGEPGVVAATSPLSYDAQTQTVSIDLSAYYTSTQADTAISNAIAGLIDSAPSTLDTLNELAAALADDASFATTITNELANKASAVHTHAISDVTNLQTELNTKASTGKAIAMALVFGGQ